MALAVLFLLAGMFAAELSLFGIDGAGVIGAALLALAAVVAPPQPGRHRAPVAAASARSSVL